MHLVSCDTPHGSLEKAPRTALFRDAREGERWDGFWSGETDGYYARCTHPDGAVQWFELADDEADATQDGTAAGVAPPSVGSALDNAHRSRTRVAVIVAQSPSGRRMLVGSARRSSRS